MKGIMDFLLSETEDAKFLRDNIIFKLVPMLNIDGVVEGNHRCSLLGVDLNRQWIHPDIHLHPTIYSTKQMISQILQAQKKLLLFVDLHGHFGKKNIFMFGCNNDTNPNLRLQECVFPFLLGQRDENFSFDSCSFKVCRLYFC